MGSILRHFSSHYFQDASNFKFTNVVCDSHNKSWIVFHECRLRVVQRNNITVNLNATLLHPVTVLHINTQILKKANGYKPWLVNVTIDFCAYLRRRNNPTINLVFGLIRTVSNLYHHCPFQVGCHL
ncbi:uncharacterized protein Dvir_GJ27102 [Drosophila virilis]|uniref:Uncharacterized protein n=1 Tax=Drosophila virilis TaxID=7244 RepID=A0A0Q9WHD4_DROVI|nr:uncharacterized protein Dvir_GJ27102 [Drosophila virilis]